MELAYAAADLVIARAGALTLAEIAVCRLPAILIPYPFATGNHQMINARAHSENRSAIIIEDKQLETVSLLEKVEELYETGQIDKMSEAASSYPEDEPRAAVDKIADEILGLIKFEKGDTIAEHRRDSNQV